MFSNRCKGMGFFELVKGLVLGLSKIRLFMLIG